MIASRALGLPIALLLAVAAAHGQSPPTFSAHELLDAHNSARARVGSPPLAWSLKSPAMPSDGPTNC